MKNILFAAALAVTAIIVSSACENPPIFSAIEQEVKLNPASVKGFVRGVGVIKIKDTFYTSNGKIYRKSEKSIGGWSVMGGCPAGLCTSIATDGTDLYATFAQGDSFTVYKYDAATSVWEKQPLTAQYVAGTNTVFAFDTTAKKVYPINGGGMGAAFDTTSIPAGAAASYYLLANGLYNAGGTKITGSPDSGLKGICKGPAGSVFVFDKSILYCYDGSNWTKIAHGVSNPQSITYLPNKRLVLLGGIRGYGEIILASDSETNVAHAKIVAAGSSDSSIPAENYHQYINSVGKYTLNPVNAFVRGTDGYVIYAGVNDPNTKYTGLWGFYNPDRKQWNRE